jgi:Fe-S oxidoreductase
MLHEGRVDRARELVDRNASVFRALPEGVEAVVVLEPSCASMLVEDAGWVVPGAPEAGLPVRSFDAFVAERGSESPFRGGGPVLVHGHCHAKALWGMDPTTRALRLAPGTDVQVVDSGCCGMAGSFGFEAEHERVSMAMGERALFPAVRDTERTVIAAGTSCRQQILHGTGRHALHPAEYLASKLRA